MNATHADPNYYPDLAREICGLPGETEWVEFKCNMATPRDIGEYISALSNSAVLNDKPYGYLVWGVQDRPHKIVGTDFRPEIAKQNNEPLENWLLRLLEPKIQFAFHAVTVDGKRVVLLEIECAKNQPVSFRGAEYIRIGEVKKPLKGIPGRERELWRAFDRWHFTELIAVEHVDDEEVLLLLNYSAYFSLLNLPRPQNRRSVLEALAGDDLIRPCPAGGWDITNLGALLLAEKFDPFPGIRRKAMRVIQYRGTDKSEAVGEHTSPRGYANGFDDLVGHVTALLPHYETLEDAIRKEVHAFPVPAVRELLANALIHQDFTVRGAGPMLEIFADRIELTNPGGPLVETSRFLDAQPRSRNETLAGLMRRFGYCEERGSGIDNVMRQVELFQLPAPRFEAPQDRSFTRVTIFSHKALHTMTREDRIDACYWHACLRYMASGNMTNATLRERFGIEAKNSSAASRIIRDALEVGAIVIQDSAAGAKSRAYLPFWAAPNGAGQGAPA